MTGGSYGTPTGGEYGTPQGLQYGVSPEGTRLELTPPEATTPEIRTDAVLSLELGLEHTAFSTMEVTLPPLEGLTESNYLNGTFQLKKDITTLFTAEIEEMNHSESSGEVTLSGKAVQDKVLNTGYKEYTFSDIQTSEAIQEVLNELPNDSRVYEAPFDPITNQIIQSAEDTGGFSQTLQAGEKDRDRYLPADTRSLLPPDYIPSQHPTTPIRIEPEGITSTRISIFKEAEDGELEQVADPTTDNGASGQKTVILKNQGDSVTVEFDFEHTVPAGWFEVAIRARKPDASSGFDLFELKLDGSTLTQFRSGIIANFPDYEWTTGRFKANEAVEPGGEDNPHTIELTKIQGNDAIYIDAFALRDDRFEFGTNREDEVDGNYALTGPPPYPDNLPLVFDNPAAGALLDIVTWTVNYDVETFTTDIFITFPELDFTAYAQDQIQDGYNIYQSIYNIPQGSETTVAYGGATIDRYDDPNRTTTPTQDTNRQYIENYRMNVDGDAQSVIYGPRTFSGTPFEILKELHDYSGRVFTIAHSGTYPGRIESFVRDDPALRNTDSENWTVTDASQDNSRERYANVVIVSGAETIGGLRYQAVTRNEAEIRRIQRISPAGDDGVRVYRTTDDSLTSDSDCRSKARTLLRSLSAVQQAGDMTIAPEIPNVGQPYLTPFAGNEDNGALEQQFSTLESATVSLDGPEGETSISFERVGGITEVLEEIAYETNQAPQATPNGIAGSGATVDSSLAIAYLSDNPLNEAAYDVGGSAGEGTHGSFVVERPANMPTRDEATYIVSNATELRNALDAAVSGDIIYIEDDIDISGFNDYAISTDIVLVAGFCDPGIAGRGPVLYDHSDPPYNRHHFSTSYPIETWGIVLDGPEPDYFDPNDRELANSEYYTTGLWCYGSTAFIYGCQFRGFTVGAIELGSSNDLTDANVTRCTIIDNPMESFGYGIYQYNGHADIGRCYFNNNRHSIAGFGRIDESYVAHECMHGPDTVSHAFDMHSPDGSPDQAGKQVNYQHCTFPFTESYAYNGGQEGIQIQGIPQGANPSTVENCHFYHPDAPVPPGEEGSAIYQEISGDSFQNLTLSGNNYGRRLEQNVGCPLNVPVDPKDS